MFWLNICIIPALGSLARLCCLVLVVLVVLVVVLVGEALLHGHPHCP